MQRKSKLYESRDSLADSIIGDLFELSRRTSLVATTFRPLGAKATCDLLWQGYTQAMVSLHVRLDFPLLARLSTTRQT
jgi:hypothetical protein